MGSGLSGQSGSAGKAASGGPGGDSASRNSDSATHDPDQATEPPTSLEKPSSPDPDKCSVKTTDTTGTRQPATSDPRDNKAKPTPGGTHNSRNEETARPTPALSAGTNHPNKTGCSWRRKNPTSSGRRNRGGTPSPLIPGLLFTPTLRAPFGTPATALPTV